MILIRALEHGNLRRRNSKADRNDQWKELAGSNFMSGEEFSKDWRDISI
jgi:hypothetical protein